MGQILVAFGSGSQGLEKVAIFTSKATFCGEITSFNPFCVKIGLGVLCSVLFRIKFIYFTYSPEVPTEPIVIKFTLLTYFVDEINCATFYFSPFVDFVDCRVLAFSIGTRFRR